MGTNRLLLARAGGKEALLEGLEERPVGGVEVGPKMQRFECFFKLIKWTE